MNKRLADVTVGDIVAVIFVIALIVGLVFGYIAFQNSYK